MTNFEKVAEFHAVYDVPIGFNPHFPPDPRIVLRLKLIDEERDELGEALMLRNLPEVADALTDLAYVVYGMALEFGIDLDKCFDEVHRSNLTKLGRDGRPLYNPDGKVIKGPDYEPPNLDPVPGL